MSRFVVVAGGSSPPLRLPLPDPSSVVVAADSGADRIRAAGWPVHHLVGDLDSVSAEAEAYCADHGAAIHRHRPDKDHTDLELALDLAVAAGATEIQVDLDPGGRLDHLLVACHVLAAPAFASARIDAVAGPTTISVVRDRRTIGGEAGDLVTLLAIGGPARLRTRGLVYTLDDEWLEATSGRGLSNLIGQAPAEVEVTDGVALVIRPG
ncbi:MAG: thiamine diphosphokinase [Acidimicrobiales bacterium]